MNKYFLPFIIAIILILSGCGQIDERSNDTIFNNSEFGYPAGGIISNGDSGYPAGQTVSNLESGYPSAEPNEPLSHGTDFLITKPVKDGDLVVTGTGPRNVPIKLVDASEMGQVLGETVILDNGTFSFTLNVPLQKRHVIGIQLGDLTGTDFDENNFIYSDTYYVRPLIGILFDLAVVE